MTHTSVEKSLYDRDLNLWLEDTVAKLKSRRFEELDLDNLIDAVESLAKRDKREFRSRLQVLLAYLLKRGYGDSTQDFRGWELTIREQRSALSQILADSPSLRFYLLENVDLVWQKALAEVQDEYPMGQFPQTCPFPLDVEAVLTAKFWHH